MINTIKNEYKKLLQTKIFCVLLMLLVTISAIIAFTNSLNRVNSVGGMSPTDNRSENGYYFEDNNVFAITLFNSWQGALVGEILFTTMFYFLLPLAASLPFSFSLMDESKTGYLRQISLKKGQKRYYLAKYIVTFSSGFFLAAIPLIVNILITACYIPAYMPDPLEQIYSGQYFNGYLSSVFYIHPYIFMIIFVLIPGAFCGLWATLSMCISMFIKNKFFVVIVPYICLFFEKAFFDALFSNRINLELSPFYFMRAGNANGTPNIYIVILILMIMFIVTIIITFIRGRNDDVY